MLNITSGKIDRALKVVVYGSEGIGKTTFAAAFPEPLFIDRKKNEDKLQRMISVGVGALCLLDLSEAAITSWGNWVVFFSHLNISAWNRLAIQGVKELHILSDREMHNIEMIEDEITEKRSELLQRSRSLLEPTN